LSKKRPSPSALEINADRASSVTGRGRSNMASARVSSVAKAASSKRCSTMTCVRDSKAALSSNDGFSVVAPTSVTTPLSTKGKNPSCCARLKRWISSTNSKVCLPVLAIASASAKAFLRSATPENTAEIGL